MRKRSWRPALTSWLPPSLGSPPPACHTGASQTRARPGWPPPAGDAATQTGCNRWVRVQARIASHQQQPLAGLYVLGVDKSSSTGCCARLGALPARQQHCSCTALQGAILACMPLLRGLRHKGRDRRRGKGAPAHDVGHLADHHDGTPGDLEALVGGVLLRKPHHAHQDERVCGQRGEDNRVRWSACMAPALQPWPAGMRRAGCHARAQMQVPRSPACPAHLPSSMLVASSRVFSYTTASATVYITKVAEICTRGGAALLLGDAGQGTTGMPLSALGRRGAGKWVRCPRDTPGGGGSWQAEGCPKRNASLCLGLAMGS